MKKNGLFLMGLGFLLVMASMALADSITLGNATTEHGNVTIRGDNFPINLTINSHNITGCLLLASSATANTSGSTIVGGDNVRGIEIGNMTLSNHYGSLPANISNFTMLVNTHSMRDANDYNISAFCSRTNGTNVSFYYANASIVIDNRFPPVASSLTSGEFTTSDITVSGTLDTDARSCVIIFDGSIPVSNPPGRTTMAQNGTTCSFTLSNVNDGTYDYRIRATDGQNETTSSIANLLINRGGKSHFVPSAPEQTTTEVVAENALSRMAGVKQSIVNVVSAFWSWITGLFA